MSAQTPDAAAWLAAYAAELGVETPDPNTITALLDMAGVAAHSSERIAAPISCWLAALAGVDADQALAAAHRVRDRLQSRDGR